VNTVVVDDIEEPRPIVTELKAIFGCYLAEVLHCRGTDCCWLNLVHIQDYNNGIIGFRISGTLEEELSFNLVIVLVILLSRRLDEDQDLSKANTIL